MVKSPFQFQNPVLTRMEFSAHNNFIIEDELSIPIKLNVHNDGIHDNTSEVNLTVTIGKPSDDMPYYLCATISSKFRWDIGTYDDETINNLLSQNAPALLLSYIRPIIANITNVSKFPVNHIPFFDFTQNSESK